MANKPGPQPDIKFCPACQGELQNIPRDEMRSKGYIRKDGTVAQNTHTYVCLSCNKGLKLIKIRSSCKNYNAG